MNVKAGLYCMTVGVVVIIHRRHKHGQTRSYTCYVTVSTILMYLGVPSKLIGCVPKVADRYRTTLYTSKATILQWGFSHRNYVKGYIGSRTNERGDGVCHHRKNR